MSASIRICAGGRFGWKGSADFDDDTQEESVHFDQLAEFSTGLMMSDADELVMNELDDLNLKEREEESVQAPLCALRSVPPCRKWFRNVLSTGVIASVPNSP